MLRVGDIVTLKKESRHFGSSVNPSSDDTFGTIIDITPENVLPIQVEWDGEVIRNHYDEKDLSPVSYMDMAKVNESITRASQAIAVLKQTMIGSLDFSDEIIVDVLGETVECHNREVGRLIGEFDAIIRKTSEIRCQVHNLSNQCTNKTAKIEKFVRRTLG